jgi:Bacterial extracellular solute-binding proteins, family 5 Middle
VQMTCACGSRSGGGLPTAPPADQPPPAPAAPPAGPEQPASPPVPAPRPPEPLADECAVIPSPGDPTATVGLTDRIDPSNAPRPTNESERLLFRQLYETLVRADCMGRVVPGLAASWRLDADGRTWIVTLRDGARFSDGTPATSMDVRASWMRDNTGDALRPEVSRLVQSVVAAGERSLAIRLHSARVDMPLALAHPDLAVAKSTADSAWPIGTRSSRVALDGDTGTAITISRDTLAPIRFVVAPGDPRDLLDRGVDLLLTRSPAALDYAATLPSFQSVPLAWRWTHVLLAPGRARSTPALSDGQRQVLADDAVRGEARGAQAPFWWQMLTDCDVTHERAPSPPRSPSSPTPRIVYDVGDTVARDLAERFVGLVRASGPGATAFLDVLLPDRPRRTFQRATGLGGEALALARRLGTDAGYVTALESHPIDPCRDLQVLTDGARWLDPETIVPLVETRLHAIVRRGRSGVTAEWDGGLIIAPAEAP